MNYGELLLDSKWRLRRYAILTRDNFTCMHCKNQSIIEHSNRGEIVELRKKRHWIDEADNLPIRKLYDIGIRYLAEKHNINLFTYGVLSHDRFKYYDLYFEFDSKDSNRLVINLLTESVEGSIDVIHIRGLHVHHKYYQKNKLPWDYPDNALVTLCWLCHKKLHAKEKIKILDEQGEEVGTYTCCFRCGGSGYFPEYNHVEGGICFRCRGAKYEELII